MHFEADRDRVLDIALVSKDLLQASLDSAKHGKVSSRRGHIVSVRDLLYGSSDTTRTICIHNRSTSIAVEYLWHSKCDVYIRDIQCGLYMSDKSIILKLDTLKMSLYVITPTQVAEGLDASCKETIVREIVEDAEGVSIVLDGLPNDIMVRCIRSTSLCISEGDWEVIGSTGEIYTVIRGDRYVNAYSYCDVILSTNLAVMVNNIGKAKVAELYSRYLDEAEVDLYLSKMLTYPHIIEDYSTICGDSIIKRITIKDQVTTLIDACLRGVTDELQNREAKLMTGIGMLDDETEEEEQSDE